eukprot:GHRR01008120.1.p1 GENE.GHRR01008120.1~~GHRR01008120.1.p1  ORF type:complete len:356 (-),score=162.24 GHRR01008120.1:2627-3694(-)
MVLPLNTLQEHHSTLLDALGEHLGAGTQKLLNTPQANAEHLKQLVQPSSIAVAETAKQAVQSARNMMKAATGQKSVPTPAVAGTTATAPAPAVKAIGLDGKQVPGITTQQLPLVTIPASAASAATNGAVTILDPSDPQYQKAAAGLTNNGGTVISSTTDASTNPELTSTVAHVPAGSAPATAPPQPAAAIASVSPATASADSSTTAVSPVTLSQTSAAPAADPAVADQDNTSSASFYSSLNGAGTSVYDTINKQAPSPDTGETLPVTIAIQGEPPTPAAGTPAVAPTSPSAVPPGIPLVPASATAAGSSSMPPAIMAADGPSTDGDLVVRYALGAVSVRTPVEQQNKQLGGSLWG